MTPRFPFDHPEIAAVLTRLHAASATDRWKIPPRLPRYAWAKLTNRLGDERVRSRIFGELYSAVTPERGALLYLMARAIQAKRVVEFGSSFGISTIYLATALRDNFPAESAPAVQLIGSEMEPAKVSEARKNIEAAGLRDLVTILQGDALETLRAVEAPIDIAFLDGRKDLYLPVLQLLRPKLRPGAVIVADNIDSFAKDVQPYLAYVQNSANGFASSTLEVSDSMELSIYNAPKTAE
jgi:predicted O-methyltransferase YrrM